MGFCEHCEGQRFDRAQVLRALRAMRKRLRAEGGADQTVAAAIEAVRTLESTHLEALDEMVEGELVH